MRINFSEGERPERARTRATGLVAVAAEAGVARIEILDGRGAGQVVEREGVAAVVVPPQTYVRAEAKGRVRWLLTTPDAEDLRALSVEDLAAIRDAVGLQSKAKGAAGIAAALGRFLGLE